jgi:hypothetical protein
MDPVDLAAYALFLHVYAEFRIMPSEISKPLIDQGKLHFFIGII